MLKLGLFCPNGSADFFRRFDNQDDGNNNRSRGNIAPNVSDDNTLLRFCLFSSGVLADLGPIATAIVSNGPDTRLHIVAVG